MGYSVPHSHDAYSLWAVFKYASPIYRLHKVTNAIRASRNYPAHLPFFLARKETNSPSILPERLVSPEVGSEDPLHHCQTTMSHIMSASQERVHRKKDFARTSRIPKPERSAGAYRQILDGVSKAT